MMSSAEQTRVAPCWMRRWHPSEFGLSMGPGTAKTLAQTVRQQLQGKTVSMTQLLERYIHQAAAPFRSTTRPGQHKRHPHLEWRPVGKEWHVSAGRYDLFTNILTRQTGLLKAADLSDSNITL